MSREALGPAFEMKEGFNDLSLSWCRDPEAEIIARLDRLLEDYGGLGAYGRTRFPIAFYLMKSPKTGFSGCLSLPSSLESLLF